MNPHMPSPKQIGIGITVILLVMFPHLVSSQIPGSPGDLNRVQGSGSAEALASHLFALSDAIGPRTTGSPAILEAEQHLLSHLLELGLQNVRIESNPPVDIGNGLELNPPGWSWQRLTVQQLAPWGQTLIAAPLLYSPPTSGTVVGEVLVAPLPPPRTAAVDSFVERYRGKLRGTFLLLRDSEASISSRTDAARGRLEDTTLAAMSNHRPEPPEPVGTARPDRPADRPENIRPAAPQNPFAEFDRLYRFLRDEGVLALIGAGPSGSGGGLLRLRATPTPPLLAESPPPMLDLLPEHFNRLLRLIEADREVRLEVNLESTFHDHLGTENVLGELRGTDLADETVVVGAHLDSWHGGTGATDNAVNVATVLEAIRILRALDLPLRRTVIVGFWGGEELGLSGSDAYVERHLVDASSGELTLRGEKVSAYLNLDYGSGRIRGIYLQGNEGLKPLFDRWLQSVGDGTLVSTLRSTLGSDQASFHRTGVPALAFIQDPMEYETRSHHSMRDDRDYVQESEASYNAEVLAGVIYRIANADDRLPRHGQP